MHQTVIAKYTPLWNGRLYEKRTTKKNGFLHINGGIKMLTNVNSTLTLNFNLREPKANKKTNIYAVIKINGEQIKKPIDCKINPWNWDKKKQSPKFTKNMTEADTENAKQVLNIIYGLRINFNTYYLHIVAKKDTEKSIRTLF